MSSWVVYAGIITSNSAKLAEYQGFAVERIIYNKNYNHRTHDNDIALVKLRTPLNFSGDRYFINHMYSICATVCHVSH